MSAEVAPSVMTEVRGDVHVVTLDRPRAANALDLATARALRQAVDKAHMSGAGALLLRANGSIFCAGGDLAAMNHAPDPSAYVDELAGIMHEVVLALAQAPFAVVSAVQGAAAGAGLSLVLTSDHVVANGAATFLAAYSSVGLTPDCGMSYLLPLSVGRQRASDVVLGGRKLSAPEAQRIGLVGTVVEEADLEATSMKIARRHATISAAARTHSKRLLGASWIDEFAARLDDERRTIAHLAGTAESRRLRTALLSRDAVS
jgi:2-(1,2-epoxy-1,2-dihydrophenyl)acetyl-CoA isomerase